MTMDAMQLAQIRRQAEWHANELRHAEAEFQSAELALVGAKKKVEEAKKKVDMKKHELEQYKQQVTAAEAEFHRAGR